MNLEFDSSINIKAVCATLLSGTTVCGLNIIENGTCLANKYLLTGGTAVCAITAGNALALCGCTPNCFLGASVGLTGATNGLHTLSQDVHLGGTLTEDTHIEGAQCFDIDAVRGFNVRTSGNTDINIDSQNCGGFLLKSQCGSIDTFPDFTNAVGFYGNIDQPSGFAIYDCRTGTGQTGIVYANDYSANYTSRSLVDKGYVDSVATGLNIHDAVLAATTGPITLSGNSGSIDGVLVTTIISVNNRILVKNQTSGATNGIYSASTGVWGRTSDYQTNIQITNGDLIPVTSGDTQNSSIWALTTPEPITVGITPLTYTEFSTVIDVQAGNGINVSMSGGLHTVSVQLATNCGLTFCGSGLAINPWVGTTANGVGTYVNGTCICSNSNMTFDGSLLNVTGCACVSNCMLIGNPTCSSARALKVGACGIYNQGNFQMPNNTAFFFGSTDDTGTRYKLFTINCHAYMDFYDCLIIRSGPLSSADVAYITSGGTICACQSVISPLICATTCFIGSGAGLTGTASSLTVGCATNASTATNALALCGCIPSCFLGATSPLNIIYSSAGSDAIKMNNTNTGGHCWYIGDGAGTSSGTIGFYNATDGCLPMSISSTGIVTALTCFAGSGAGLTGTASNLTAGNALALCSCTPNCFAAAVHSHGSLNNGGCLGTAAGCIVCTSTSGCLATITPTSLNVGCANIVNIASGNEMTLDNGFAGGVIYVNYRGSSGAITSYLMGNGIANGGLACVCAIDFIATSDCRIKTCICPICNALSTVLNLQGVNYQSCNDETHTNRIGLIAQDTIKVLPEVVTIGIPDDKDSQFGITDGKMGITYDKLTAVLVEAIKELNEKVNALSLELNYMRNTNK